MQITARHDLFAGQVDGVDCTAATAPALAAELRAALRRHAVLVFPNQVLDDDQQIAYSTAFGPLEQTKVGTLGSGSQVVILTNVDPDGAEPSPSAQQPRQYAVAHRQLVQTDPGQSLAIVGAGYSVDRW